MQLFLDTAAIDEIRTAARWGVVAGMTTNPSLFAEVGGRYEDVLRQICQLTAGPVSAEVVAADVRLDDVNEHGMDVVRDLAAVVRAHGLAARVLAASIRSPRQVTEAALAGAHIATVPPAVLRQMVHHPLTEAGITRFRRDWEAVREAVHTPPDAAEGIEAVDAGPAPGRAASPGPERR